MSSPQVMSPPGAGAADSSCTGAYGGTASSFRVGGVGGIRGIRAAGLLFSHELRPGLLGVLMIGHEEDDDRGGCGPLARRRPREIQSPTHFWLSPGYPGMLSPPNGDSGPIRRDG